MADLEYTRIVAQIAVLKDVQKQYSGKNIDNIIQQLESIRDWHLRHMEGR